MSRILIISPFFFPEQISSGKTNTDLVEGLIKDQHEITVICSHPLYPKWKVTKTTENIEGIKTIRGGSWIHYPSSLLLRRIILETWFAIFSFYNYIKLRNHKDVIISVFPPTLFAYLIHFFKKKEIRYIGLIHDLQTVYSSNNKKFFGKILFYIILYFEKAALNSYDHLIFWSQDMKKIAKNTFGLQKVKCSFHYPTTNISQNKITNKLENLFIKGQRSIVYSGALGEKQAPKKLLNFLDLATTKFDKIDAYVFSDGENFEALKKLTKNPKIHFYPLVDKEYLPELLMRSDIQIIPQLEGTSNGSLPSKLPNLIAASCKILCITDKNSEIEKLLNNYSKSCIANDWDEKTLLNAISTLLKKDTFYNLDSQREELLKLFSLTGLIEKIFSK